MAADRNARVVFVADSLERQFVEVHRRPAATLRGHGDSLGGIPGMLPVWCRDNLPVSTAEGRFVQLRYEPDYLDGRYRYLRADGGDRPATSLARGLYLIGGRAGRRQCRCLG